MDQLEKELRTDDEAEYEEEEVDPRIQVTTISMHSIDWLIGSL